MANDFAISLRIISTLRPLVFRISFVYGRHSFVFCFFWVLFDSIYSTTLKYHISLFEMIYSGFILNIRCLAAENKMIVYLRTSFHFFVLLCMLHQKRKLKIWIIGLFNVDYTHWKRICNITCSGVSLANTTLE